MGLSRRAQGALKGAKFLILAFLTSKMASVWVIIKTKKLPGILRLPLMIQLMSYVFLFCRQNICNLLCPRPPNLQLKGLLGQNLSPFLALYSSLIKLPVSIIFQLKIRPNLPAGHCIVKVVFRPTTREFADSVV